MTKKEKIEERAWNLIRPIAEEKGYIPVDVEYLKEGGNSILRASIDRTGGITIDDCEILSRAVDKILDEENFIGEPYTMEVSSPGLGRKLKRPHELEYGKGREIEVRTYRPVEGQKSFTGLFQDYSDTTIFLETKDGTMTIPRTEISVIRLTYDIE